MKHRSSFRVFIASFIFIFVLGMTIQLVAQVINGLRATDVSALVVDNNGNGLADGGDIIEYTVQIANCSALAVSGARYESDIDPNTVLIPNSIQITTQSTTLCNNIPPDNNNPPPPPPPPVNADAVDDAFSVTNGGATTGAVLTNDTGVAPLSVVSFGDSLATVGATPADGVTVLSLPAGGGTLDITLDSAGNITITSTGSTGSGAVTLFYAITSGNATTDSAQITLTYGDFPTAVDDTTATLGAGEYTTPMNTALTIPVGTGLLNNDTLGTPPATLTLFGGGDASALVNIPAGTPQNFGAGGSLTVNTDGSFSFTPATGYSGYFTFSYTIDNGFGTSTADVTIAVQGAPTAVNDSGYAVGIGGTLLIIAITPDDLLDNDTLGVPPATLTSFGAGDLGGAVIDNVAGASVALAGGTITVNADGSFIFATPSIAGTYTFNYRITNLAGTSDASVTIVVTNAPIAENDAFTVALNGTLNGDLNDDNGSGADTLGVPPYNTLTFGAGSLGGAITDNPSGASVPLAGGTLTVNLDGTFSLVNPTLTGVYTFNYRINNTIPAFDDATVTIAIQQAPFANNDSYVTLTGTTLTITTAALNDLLDNDLLGVPPATLTSFGAGDLGGLVTDSLAGASVTLAGGTITVNADGSFTFANPTLTGIYSFNYRITNAAGTSDGTVFISIQTAPIAEDDAFTVALNGTLNGDLNNNNGNGADMFGVPAYSTLTFGGGSLGGAITDNNAPATVPFAGGSLTVNVDGTFSLVNPTLTGTFTFNYRISNTFPASDDAIVTITIQEAPFANNDSYVMLTGATLTITTAALNDLLDNDTLGVPPATLTSFGAGNLGGAVTDNVAGSTVALGGGAITVNGDGSFTFTTPTIPNTYTFIYRITNVAGTSDAMIFIDVQQAPIAENDAFTVALNGTLNGDLNDNNGSGADVFGTPAYNTLTFGAGSLGGAITDNNAPATVPFAGGSLTVNVDGTFSLINPTSLGAFTFDYRISNTIPASDDATVTITVGALANDDVYTITPHLTYNSALAGLSVRNNDTPPDSITVEFFGDSLATAGSTAVNGTNFITAGGANGRVVMNPDGTFLFYPDAGDDAPQTVTFFYTITGGDTAQVTLTFDAQEMVWFVDNAIGLTVCTGTNLGTQACPAPTVTDAASHEAGNTIFIADGAYTCGITLQNGAIVVGDGSSSDLQTISGVTPVAGSNFTPYATFSGTDPTLTTTVSGVNCFTLGATNTIRGVTIGDVGVGGDATDIFGTNFGALTIRETTLTGTGRALLLNTGGLDALFDSISTTSSTTHGIFMDTVNGTMTSPTTTLNNTVSNAILFQNSAADIDFGATSINKGGLLGTAMLIQTNTSASDLTFGGAGNLFTVTTSTGAGMVAIDHDGSITVNGTNAASDVNTTSGACFSIDGPVGMTDLNITVDTCFSSVTGSNGILLRDTGGALFRISNTVGISTVAGAGESILLDNADTSTIDIGAGSTVTISNRRDEAIRVTNGSGASIVFGNVTADNPVAVTAPAIRMNLNSANVVFDQTNINQGNIGGANEFGAGQIPTVNNAGLGDAISIESQSGNVSIAGGTLQAISDDGVDIRTSTGMITLNNMTINHGASALNGIAGVQLYNSTNFTINNSTIQNVDAIGACPANVIPRAVSLIWDGANGGTANIIVTDIIGTTTTAQCNSGVYTYHTSSGTVNVNVLGAATMQNFTDYSVYATLSSATNGRLNVDINAITVPSNSAIANSDAGFWITGSNTGIITADITTNTLTDFSDAGVGIALVTAGTVDMGDGGAGGLVSNITGNTLADTGGVTHAVGVLARLDGAGDLDLNLTNNNISGASASALNLFTGNASVGNMTVFMQNNIWDVVTTGTAQAAANIILDGVFGNVTVRDNGNTYDGTGVNQSFRWQIFDAKIGSYVANNVNYTTGTLRSTFIQTQDTSTLCVDMNDDGGGGNISAGVVYIENGATGVLNAENGNLPANFAADNPAVASFSLSGVINAFAGECAVANP